MYDTYENDSPEAIIRNIFLRQLSGDELTKVEKTYLAIANKSPFLTRMCDELKSLYHSPEMSALLRERPNSERLDELVARALHVGSRKYKVPFVRRILAVFC